MFRQPTRREFLKETGLLAGGLLAAGVCRGEPAASSPSGSPSHATGLNHATGVESSNGARARVVIARDEALLHGRVDEHRELLRKLLNATMQRLTQTPDAKQAWRKLFRPQDRIGIKVNTLGLTTQPAVVDAIVTGLRTADVPAENITIWDRFDVELAKAGYKLNKSADGVKCRGTDAEHYGSGYQKEVEISGEIGSCFSRIVAEEVDTLISVPVLKDHNLAGVSLGLKNFFGAIHNPNKYHDRSCDPYIVDVADHRFIRPKWRLTICDGPRAQCSGGPMRSAGFAWDFGGLIVSNDVVAADAVAADLLAAERKHRGLKMLAQDNRPPVHIATAAARGLGRADLTMIERVEV